jgi:cyclo(L-tyrosyl-L-tyrosyl) synthase
MSKVDGVVVWMSAGNSYFKEEVIMKTLELVSKKFSKIVIMAPDEPAEHTFKALGLYENNFKRKARLNANLLQNRAKRVVEKLVKNRINNDFKIVEWIDEIIPNKDYQTQLKLVNDLYEHNPLFRKDARDTTKAVIINKISKDVNIEKAIDEAVNYLLEELAFVIASPKIYGTVKMTYVYHHNWLIYENLISGKYDSQKRPELAFMLIEV